MAIVLNTEPLNTVSINNEILFVAYEATKATDPVTYPDYSYICDVYVDSTMIARLIARPDPEHNRGIFDVSKALQAYASYGFNAGSNKVDYTVKLAYRCKFGEQYDGTLYTNLVVDSTDRECYETYKRRSFLSSAVLENGLASNMPDTVNWHESQSYHLVSYFSDVSGISNLVETFKDANGNTLGTGTVDNSDFVAKKIRQANLRATAIPTGTEYSLITGANVSLRINYLCDGKYTPYTLVWLNPYGGYDSQSFGLVSKKSLELARKQYERLNYEINSSGIISYHSNNVMYGGKKGYNTTVKQRMSFTSHLLTEDEYTWLADLFISPEVYFFDTGVTDGVDDVGKFVPVIIGQNNYEYRNYANSRLTPLQFDVEFTDSYNSQFL